MLYLLVYIIKHTTDETFFSNLLARRVKSFDQNWPTNFKVADEAYIVEHFAADWAEYAQGYGCLLNNFDKFISKIESVHVCNHCSRRKKLVPWMKII